MSGIIADLTKTPPSSVPDCYARVIHFTRRDTRNYANKKAAFLPIEGEKGARHGKDMPDSKITGAEFTDIASDILSCMIQKSKNAVSGTFSLVLAPGDINYHHLLHPGDHIFIWMKRRRPANATKNAQGHLPSSMVSTLSGSGLKLYGIITAVRRTFTTDASGKKTLRYTISGKDFGYFYESSIYYNVWIAEQLRGDAALFEFSQIGASTIGGVADNSGKEAGGYYPPNKLVSGLMLTYLGEGPKDKIIGKVQRPITEARTLYLPSAVFATFGIKGGSTFKDALVVRSGIETYGGNIEPQEPLDMAGIKQYNVDIGNKTSLWDAMNAVANLTLNEMFVDLKPHKEGKSWYLRPTFTFRQIPFTTTAGAVGIKSVRGDTIPVTKFVDLPRVRIPESFIIQEDTGRSDAGRTNMVELFTVVPGDDAQNAIQVMQQQGNYVVDIPSINRIALRPMVCTTDYYPAFDVLKKNPNLQHLIPGWTEVLADWWLGAHIYENGSLSLVGIEEALSIGDNLEIVRQNGVSEIYHIESYQHIYSVGAEGHKAFRTNVSLTRGQRTDERPIYASGQINEEDILDIGLVSNEPEGTGRSGMAAKESVQALDSEESLPNRKKKQP